MNKLILFFIIYLSLVEATKSYFQAETCCKGCHYKTSCCCAPKKVKYVTRTVTSIIVPTKSPRDYHERDERDGVFLQHLCSICPKNVKLGKQGRPCCVPNVTITRTKTIQVTPKATPFLPMKNYVGVILPGVTAQDVLNAKVDTKPLNVITGISGKPQPVPAGERLVLSTTYSVKDPKAIVVFDAFLKPTNQQLVKAGKLTADGISLDFKMDTVVAYSTSLVVKQSLKPITRGVFSIALNVSVYHPGNVRAMNLVYQTSGESVAVDVIPGTSTSVKSSTVKSSSSKTSQVSSSLSSSTTTESSTTQSSLTTESTTQSTLTTESTTSSSSETTSSSTSQSAKSTSSSQSTTSSSTLSTTTSSLTSSSSTSSTISTTSSTSLSTSTESTTSTISTTTKSTLTTESTTTTISTTTESTTTTISTTTESTTTSQSTTTSTTYATYTYLDTYDAPIVDTISLRGGQSIAMSFSVPSDTTINQVKVRFGCVISASFSVTMRTFNGSLPSDVVNHTFTSTICPVANYTTGGTSVTGGLAVTGPQDYFLVLSVSNTAPMNETVMIVPLVNVIYVGGTLSGPTLTYNATETSWTNIPGKYYAASLIYDTTPPCFPPESIVWKYGVGMIEMREVKVGDYVLGIDEDGRLRYTRVMLIPHMNLVEDTEYVMLETSKGKLYATADHFLYVTTNGTWLDKQVKKADQVKVGEFMWFKLEDDLILSRVDNISRVELKGYGTLFTESGNFIVESFAASGYTDVLGTGNDVLIHRLMGIHRWIHRNIPWFSNLLVRLHTRRMSQGKFPLLRLLQKRNDEGASWIVRSLGQRLWNYVNDEKRVVNRIEL